MRCSFCGSWKQPTLDTLAIISQSLPGKQVSLSTNLPEQTDVTSAKELGVLAMSEYSTKALYVALSNVCSNSKKPFVSNTLFSKN